MIVVVNLGISNLSSVVNALHYLGIDHLVTDKIDEVDKATHLILPGVGTFEAGMSALSQRGMVETVRRSVLVEHKPILGICLGMQLLFDSSAESPRVAGLSVLPGSVEKLQESTEYPIPRIGWCESDIKRDFLSFSKDVAVDFYYIHSYHVIPGDSEIIAVESGANIKVTSAIQSGNIYGVQFHPEKSHTAGLKILDSFSRLKI